MIPPVISAYWYSVYTEDIATVKGRGIPPTLVTHLNHWCEGLYYRDMK